MFHFYFVMSVVVFFANDVMAPYVCEPISRTGVFTGYLIKCRKKIFHTAKMFKESMEIRI